MAKKAYRVHNWGNYNKSLVSRGSLTFWFSRDVLKNWQSDTKSKFHGNQKYSDMVIICGLTLRQLFRLPLRATQGLMSSLVQLMKLSLPTPNYSTLCRRAGSLKIDFRISPRKTPRHILVDSTGVQVIGEGEWKRLRHGEEKHQVWRKLHIAMDADDQAILAASVTESVRLDGNCMPGLIEKIDGVICQITGDGAYDKKSCYQTAYLRGAKPVFPPQHNARVQRNKYSKDPALEPRDEAILKIGRGVDRIEKLKKWKLENNYHDRSLVETMMSRMKSIFGDKMRSRKYENQQADLLIRCYAMNRITQLGMPISEAL